MHEMGEIKRALELRVNEFSVQKSRDRYETIQRFTSQVQGLQERVNCMNGSGEVQEVESIELQWTSGQFSHVPSQPAVIPSPRSMLSCDKRLPLDTLNLSGSQENVFVNPRSRFESSRTPYQGILHSTTLSATGAVPVRVCTGTPVARGAERIGSTIPMPTFAGRPSTMNSFLPVGIPLNSMAGQQRLQISELQFDKFPTPQSFLCWQIRCKNQVTTCSDFPSEVMLWIKAVKLIDSVDEFESS